MLSVQHPERECRTNCVTSAFFTRGAPNESKQECLELCTTVEAGAPVDQLEICGLQDVLRGSAVPPAARECPPEGSSVMAGKFVVEIGHNRRMKGPVLEMSDRRSFFI